MSKKGKIGASFGEIGWKRRKVADIEMKIKITEDYEATKTFKKEVCDLKFAYSTVSTIIKVNVRVKEAVQIIKVFKSVITRQRIYEMDILLAIWFDIQVQNNI